MYRQNASSNLLNQERPSNLTEKIINSRSWFKWLPVRCSSDLELGSWFFVIGSVMYMCIPLFPLLSNGKLYWPTERAVSGYSVDDDGISHNEVIMEGLLVFVSGLFFTIGSYCWVRACRVPPSPPFSEAMRTTPACSCIIKNCFNFYETDELLGAWCYYFACLPFVPYMMIYVAKNPGSPALWGSFSLLCIVLGIFALMIRACMPAAPDVTIEAAPPPSKFMANLWVFACWAFFIICLIMTVLLGCSLVASCASNDIQAVIIYSLFVVDMFFWTAGSAYFVAGSNMFDPTGDVTGGSIISIGHNQWPAIQTSTASSIHAPLVTGRHVSDSL